MGRNSRYITDDSTLENKKKIIWKIAVYIRLSHEDGSAESESVTNQKKILEEFLVQYFSEPYEITDYYIDDGLSGTDDNRISFMRMIQDIEQKKVNCVVCKTLSRAFRNYSDQGYYLEYYFPQKNIRFISVGDPKIDTHLNPEVITGLEVPITGLMNDRYAAKTSSDIRRTFNTKRRSGEFIGAFPPYGYLKSPNDKNQLILDEEIVPVKRDIYSWIVHSGMSLSGIAKRLNERGIPNPTAYKLSKGWHYFNPKAKENDGLWTGSTVRRVMLDRVNLGHMIQGRQRVVSYKVHDRIAIPQEEWFVKENTHEPTFTQEEYDTMANLLARDTRAPTGKPTLHLFSGFLKCRDCGKALHRKSSGNRVYYACRTYTEKSPQKCTRHSIRLDVLERAVLTAIQMQIALACSLKDIIDEIVRSPNVNTQSDNIRRLLAERKEDADKLHKITDGLYIDWKSGEISLEDYRRMKKHFTQQMEQLQAVILNLEEEQQNIEKNIAANNPFFCRILKYNTIEKLDRSLLAELVDTIYVHENNEITIVFCFQDELGNL